MNSALQCSQLEEAEKATIYFCNDAALINCYVFNSTRVLKIELGASLLAARGVEEARESQLPAPGRKWQRAGEKKSFYYVSHATI